MQAKHNFSEDNLSLDGLEELLDDTDVNELPIDKARAQDFSVEETAKTLGLTRGAVIRRLEDGILEGYRIRRPYGIVWRVCDPRLFRHESAPESVQDSKLAEKKRKIRRFVEETQRTTGEHSSASLEAPASVSDPELEGMLPPSADEFQNLPHVEVIDVDLDELELPALTQEQDLDLVELRTKLEMTEFQFQDALSKLDQANYKIGYLEARLETSQEQMRLLTDQHAHQPWWQRWRQWFRTMP